MPQLDETLDRIARSGEAVFAIDPPTRSSSGTRSARSCSADPPAACSGKRCYDAIGGRDAAGNVYCFRNCPVAPTRLARSPRSPFSAFRSPSSFRKGGREWFEISLFAIPSYHPALSTVVHVIRPETKKASALERKLAEAAPSPRAPLAHDDQGGVSRWT